MFPDLLQTRRGRVAGLTLNRPQARNALNRALCDQLAAALAEVERDDSLSVVVLAGAGRHFAAGADIAEMAGLSAEEVERTDFAGCCPDLGTFGKPVVTLVQGVALGGGCELVEMSDVVIAAEDARFGHPEITLGTMPGCGGTQRLMRAAGKARAMDMLLTGEPVDAATAQAAGLVSRIVPADRLEAEGWAVAARIANFPLAALKAMKAAARLAHEEPLARGLRQERRLFQQGLLSPPTREGMTAFLEKRPPAWHEAD